MSSFANVNWFTSALSLNNFWNKDYPPRNPVHAISVVFNDIIDLSCIIRRSGLLRPKLDRKLSQLIIQNILSIVSNNWVIAHMGWCHLISKTFQWVSRHIGADVSLYFIELHIFIFKATLAHKINIDEDSILVLDSCNVITNILIMIYFIHWERYIYLCSKQLAKMIKGSLLQLIYCLW